MLFISAASRSGRRAVVPSTGTSPIPAMLLIPANALAAYSYGPDA